MSLTRRAFVTSTVATAVVTTAAHASTPMASPAASPMATPVSGRALYLIVADSKATSVSIVDAASRNVLGTLDGIALSSHAGVLPLPDGTVLFLDDVAQRLLHVGVQNGTPAILHEAKVPGHYAHLAVNGTSPTHAAIGCSDKDPHQIHIVDLTTFEPVSIAIPDAAEVGLAMTNDTLFHRNSKLNRIEAYPLADLLAGTVKPVATMDIGTFGHGEAIDLSTGELFCASDDGIDTMFWKGSKLEFNQTYAWPDAKPMARGFFARLSFDGSSLLTYTSDRSAEETAWDTWKNVSVMYDVKTGEAKTAELGNGYTFRFALADTIAFMYVMGGKTDEALVLDVDHASASYGTVTKRIPLAAIDSATKVGEPFYERAVFRGVAVLPDGSFGFVSRAGHGEIEVLDLVGGSSSGMISVPTPLDDGGALGVFGPGMPFVDTIAR